MTLWRSRRLWVAAGSLVGVLLATVPSSLAAWNASTQNSSNAVNAAAIGHSNNAAGSGITCHSTSTTCGTLFNNLTLGAGNSVSATLTIVVDSPPSVNASKALLSATTNGAQLCFQINVSVVSGTTTIVGSGITMASLASAAQSLTSAGPAWTAGSTIAYQISMTMSSSAPQTDAGAANACQFSLIWEEDLGAFANYWKVTTTDPGNSIALAVTGTLATIQLNHLTASGGYPPYRVSWSSTGGTPTAADIWTCVPATTPGCTAVPGATGTTQQNTTTQSADYNPAGPTDGSLCTDTGTPSATNHRTPANCGYWNRSTACISTFCFDEFATGVPLANNSNVEVRVRMYFGSPSIYTDSTVFCKGGNNTWTCS